MLYITLNCKLNSFLSFIFIFAFFDPQADRVFNFDFILTPFLKTGFV